MTLGVYTVHIAGTSIRKRQMQDYETSQDSSSSLEDEQPNRIEDFIRSLLKKLVVFICFGPGVLGVMWIIGRLFKR